jgi:hypothetical protein
MLFRVHYKHGGLGFSARTRGYNHSLSKTPTEGWPLLGLALKVRWESTMLELGMANYGMTHISEVRAL